MHSQLWQRACTHPIHISRGVSRKVAITGFHRIREGGQKFLLVCRRQARPGQLPHPKIRVAIRYGYSQGSETNKERSKESTQWNDVSTNSKQRNTRQPYSSEGRGQVKAKCHMQASGPKTQSRDDVIIHPNKGVHAKCLNPSKDGICQI